VNYLKWKSKEEIEAANLADWEKEVILENFEFEQNLSELGKVVLEYAKNGKTLKDVIEGETNGKH
jgi:hypothetical protein